MPKKPATNPVLPEHVILFDEFIVKWRALLNLRDWRIVRSTKKTKEVAEIIEILHEHKLAHYVLGADFGSKTVTPHALESVACHELLHVLLSGLVATAVAEGEENNATLEYEHAAIIVIEELLMHAYGEKHADETALGRTCPPGG